MNARSIQNFSKLKPSLLLLPLFLLALIFLFLYKKNALSAISYIEIQKDAFYYLNGKLSQFPQLQLNLTQFGDAFIGLSLLSIFFLYAPRLWETLLSASIVSALICVILKPLFCVPRPAAVFDRTSFAIIGRVHPGKKSSLPSGHSVTVFTIIIVIMFAFMPKKTIHKILWCLSLIAFGYIVAFSRVAIGAHFILDVIIGSILGFIAAILGIFISRKYEIWRWITNKKYYPFFILLFLAGVVIVTFKIATQNLAIHYFVLLSLIFSLYNIIMHYAKK